MLQLDHRRAPFIAATDDDIASSGSGGGRSPMHGRYRTDTVWRSFIRAAAAMGEVIAF